jgi:hypothetical protein
VDGSGNVFVADYGNSKAKEILAAGDRRPGVSRGSGITRAAAEL